MNKMFCKIHLYSWIFCVFVLSISSCFAQGIHGKKLKNGLTVYIWEDPLASNTFGSVGVRVGSYDDPEDYTGLAHYLEHLLFKGTQQIGAIDWSKEKVIYDNIIAKYDEHANEQDPIKKNLIKKEINQLTIEAAQYGNHLEFWNLLEGLGSTGTNAGTNFDQTVYFNNFPNNQLNNWLELSSERFMNPVFRTFQTELETVYEEYNMYNDMEQYRIREIVYAHLFNGTPYARSIIGLGKHLKNPRISKLIEFYNTWYVPSNMVLVISGNIKAAEAFPIIEETFGRLEKKEVPQRKQYPQNVFKGRKVVTEKIATTPMVIMAFNGITVDHEDVEVLEVCLELLNNRDQTGIIDKLVLDGDLLYASANVLALKADGKLFIQGIPSFDMNRFKFDFNRNVEKYLNNSITILKEGKFDDWVLAAVKINKIRDFERSIERPSTKAMLMQNAFLNGHDIDDVINYIQKIESISIDQIKTVAKKYFNEDVLVVHFEEGKLPKLEKLETFDSEPVIANSKETSPYQKWFTKQTTLPIDLKFADLTAIPSKSINSLSKIYYAKNNVNDVFNVTIRYGVGLNTIPELAYAVPLMNVAGIMGSYSPTEFKQELSKLGGSVVYSVSENNLVVQITGYEINLEEICLLVTRHILMPKLEDKQLDGLKGGILQGRRREKTEITILTAALREYLFYGDKSQYINRFDNAKVRELSFSKLTGDFQRATNYQADIFYSGALPFDSVYNMIASKLPLKEGETAAVPLKLQTFIAQNDKPTIYFLPQKNAQQAQIFFYVKGENYQFQQDALIDIFNSYFYRDVVYEQVRNERALSYSPGGGISNKLTQTPLGLVGALSTQNEKTLEAVQLFHDFMTKLPQKSDRLPLHQLNIKQNAASEKPSFREQNQVLTNWLKRGYTEDPNIAIVRDAEKITMEDINAFYNSTFNMQHLSIGIVGDPLKINLKDFEKFGKVIKLNSGKLFKD